jgi:NADH dehydrogenase (ubiquinone) 1 alpha subcomplex subunit 13
MMTTASQDLPPPGGFPEIIYKGRFPKRGPSGLTLLLGGAVMISFGLYMVIQGNRERKELTREKILARMNLVPLLQAEEDRR